MGGGVINCVHPKNGGVCKMRAKCVQGGGVKKGQKVRTFTLPWENFMQRLIHKTYEQLNNHAEHIIKTLCAVPEEEVHFFQ